MFRSSLLVAAKRSVSSLAITLFFATSPSVFASSYRVPQTYDHMFNGQKSLSYGVINNAITTISGNSYVIGSESVRYKCLVAPKITCHGSTVDPQISAVVSEVSLRDPVSGEHLGVFNSDVRIEKDTGVGVGNFYVCAAAYGGLTFDNFSMSSDGVNLSYTFKGNAVLRSFIYFSNKAASTDPANHSGSGSTGSYITIEHKQVCQ